jgi:hypothetical protein
MKENGVRFNDVGLGIWFLALILDLIFIPLFLLTQIDKCKIT